MYVYLIYSKPTITITAMQERHDNDKIEHHSHNEYPLLYKEPEIPVWADV